jgi:hypothetical protein
MAPDDTTTQAPEPETADTAEAVSDVQTEEDKEAAEVTAWFNEDPPVDPTAPALAESAAADADEDDAPEPEAPADAKPAAPAPVKGEAPAKVTPPPAEPETAVSADTVFYAFDLSAAVKDLPKTLKVEGKDIDIGTLVTDFPEIAPLAATIAERIVQQRLAPILPMIEAMQARQQNEAFLDAVAEKVPDVRQVVGTKAFREWVDRQPVPLQKLAKSDDVDSAAFVLAQYATARKTGKPATQHPAPPASPAFEKRKAATLGTLAGKTSARTGPASPDPQDYKNAFNED